MVSMTLQHHSSDTLLSSIISSYLLTDPPSPTSSLPSLLTLINDRKPFLTIPSTFFVLHKWNTRVSSLIQSKSVESRYWGICLAKATIANGGEGLGHVTVWAKLLLNLLHRPEGSVLLERAITTLATLFGLISTHPTLSRELNSLLPGFFSALMNVSSEQALLPAILTALHALIPDHANVFRASLGTAGPLMVSLLDGPYSPSIKQLAAKVFVDLHHCAPKGTSSEQWRSNLVSVISEVHIVLDRLFEVVEEGCHRHLPADSDRTKIVGSKGLGLRPLDDDYSVAVMTGTQRIQTLVVVIQEFLTLPTKQTVNIPLGHIVNLAMRVYSVGVDSRPRDASRNDQISLLFMNLSPLYTQMNILLLTVIKCVNKSFLPHFRPVLSELVNILTATDSDSGVMRISTYDLLSHLLRDFGAGLHSTREVKLLETIVKVASSDIASLSSFTTLPSLTTTSKSRKRKHNANQPVETTPPTSLPPTPQIVAAVRLITEILRLTPLLTLSTRSSIDQVVLSMALRSGAPSEVVCALHGAIVTSIQFPATVAVLPHAIRILERDCGADMETVRLSAVRGLGELEGIIHSRLPPQKGPAVSTQQTQGEDEKVEKGGEEEEEEEEVVDEMVVEETVVEEVVANGDENPEVQVSITETATTISEPNPPQSNLPSFVTAATQKKRPPPVQKMTEAVPLTATKVVKSTKDVYSRGAWRGVQTNEDEEDEEMPEIDMGFDSDEE